MTANNAKTFIGYGLQELQTLTLSTTKKVDLARCRKLMMVIAPEAEEFYASKLSHLVDIQIPESTKILPSN